MSLSLGLGLALTRNKGVGDGPVVYADPAAVGAGNGTSWADAFTTLEAAFAAVVTGGTVYSNSTQAVPFPPADVSGAIPDNIQWRTDRGPDAQTWISGKRASTWTDMGSGVFRCTPVGTVSAAAYDLKADDTAGTVTGVNLTTTEMVADLAEWGVAAADCVAWYGVLEKEASATATPAEGKWSATGGFLYINPPGSPNLATVQALASYANTVDGIAFTKTGSVHNGLRIRGNLTVFFTPSSAPGTGYSVKHNNAKNCRVENVRSIMCGYHAVGFIGNSEEGNSIRSCVTTQQAADSSGTANPYVFYSAIARDMANASYVADGLVFLGVPLLKTTGAPLTALYGPGLGYSHTDGTYDLGGILWNRCLQVDFVQELEAKHSVTITNTYKFITAEYTGGTFERFTPSTWPVQATNCKARGRAAWFQSYVDHYDCRMDRSGYGAQGNLLVLMNSSAALWQFRMTDCLIWTGECRRGWSGTQVGEAVSFFNCEVLFQGTGSNAAFDPTLLATLQPDAGQFYVSGCIMDGISTNTMSIFQGDAGATGGYEACNVNMLSAGNNIFGNKITESFDSTHGAVPPKPMSYWTSTITGGATDQVNVPLPLTIVA